MGGARVAGRCARGARSHMRPASPQLSMGSNKGAAERDQRGCLGKPGAHVSGAAIRQGGWSAASQCCRAHLANVGLGQLLLARGAGPAAGDLARVDLCRGWAGWEAQVSGKWGQATRCMRLTGAPMSLPASSAEPGRDQGWLAGWLAGWQAAIALATLPPLTVVRSMMSPVPLAGCTAGQQAAHVGRGTVGRDRRLEVLDVCGTACRMSLASRSFRFRHRTPLAAAAL